MPRSKACYNTCPLKKQESIISISRCIALLLLILFSQLNYSQSFSKLWGAATYFGRYNQLLYTVEPQIRLIDSANRYDQSLLNAGIGQTIMPQLQIWLGQTYINYADTNNIAEDIESVVLNEYRIWEQVVWRRPFFESLALRSRLEQRHAFDNAEWAVRFRERGFWTIPLNETLSFALNDEFFLNLKSAPWVTTPFFDQNRLFIGIFYKFTPNIGVNISYMNQYINKINKEYNNGIVLNLIIYAF